MFPLLRTVLGVLPACLQRGRPASSERFPPAARPPTCHASTTNPNRVPPPCQHTHKLSIWTPSDGSRAYLLLCPDRQQFVLLLTPPETGGPGRRHGSSSGALQSVNALLACARHQAGMWLRHNNPFVDHTQQPAGDTAVLTFEIDFQEVVGMDFRCVFVRHCVCVTPCVTPCVFVCDCTRFMCVGQLLATQEFRQVSSPPPRPPPSLPHAQVAAD